MNRETNRYKEVCLAVLLIICTGSMILVPGAGSALAGEWPESESSASGHLRTSSQPRLTLTEAIDMALKNNPRIRRMAREIETEGYNIRAAKAERMPKVDLTSGVARYRYPAPLTPIVIDSPTPVGLQIPRFERTIYDAGLILRLPLYRGGRLQRNVAVAELRKGIAEDNHRFTRADLIYNVTSVYHKVLQIERLRTTSDATVRQVEAHRRDAETLHQAGSVPYLDLIKTDVELGHAVRNRFLIENSLESAFELLRTLVGREDTDWRPVLSVPVTEAPVCSDMEQCRKRARNNRTDLMAVEKKLSIGKERVRIAQGKRYPDIWLGGQYFDRSGTDFSYKENWDVGVRMTLPLFDGGMIAADVAREKNELAKLEEEKRELYMTIEREVKDAFLALENARSRIAVADKAVASARENLRVEELKYRAGATTNSEVVDAWTGMERAESDLYQAIFDRDTAAAALKRAVGEVS